MFPYHLGDVMVLKLQTTPFDYYYEILSTMLRNDRSYDSMPNFTAADCKLKSFSTSIGFFFSSMTFLLVQVCNSWASDATSTLTL